jgi:hypothetical protein
VSGFVSLVPPRVPPRSNLGGRSAKQIEGFCSPARPPETGWATAFPGTCLLWVLRGVPRAFSALSPPPLTLAREGQGSKASPSL